MFNFIIESSNRFGDLCYREVPHNSDINESSLLPNKIWTVINPSEGLIKYNSGEVRTYGNNTFLMSKEASIKIQKPGHHSGEAVVVSTSINGRKYFLLVADNKPYWQNIQGGMNDDEYDRAGTCIIREMEEEAKINIKPKDLIQVGHWSFLFKNPLVGDYESEARTALFYVELPMESIQHLLVGKLEGITIFDTKDYNFELDETKYIMFIPHDLVDSAETEINGLKFDGHHRETLRRILGRENKPINYLYSFEINF